LKNHPNITFIHSFSQIK